MADIPKFGKGGPWPPANALQLRLVQAKAKFAATPKIAVSPWAALMTKAKPAVSGIQAAPGVPTVAIKQIGSLSGAAPAHVAITCKATGKGVMVTSGAIAPHMVKAGLRISPLVSAFPAAALLPQPLVGKAASLGKAVLKGGIKGAATAPQMVKGSGRTATFARAIPAAALSPQTVVGKASSIGKALLKGGVKGKGASNTESVESNDHDDRENWLEECGDESVEGIRQSAGGLKCRVWGKNRLGKGDKKDERKGIGKGRRDKNRNQNRGEQEKVVDCKTGANIIEVNWKPPQKSEEEQAKEAQSKSKDLFPVRGPAGRGRGSAIPAWMTKAEPSIPQSTEANDSIERKERQDGIEKSEFKAESNECESGHNDDTETGRVPPEGPAGRGRCTAIPAWMKQGVGNTATSLIDKTPCIPEESKEPETNALDEMFQERIQMNDAELNAARRGKGAKPRAHDRSRSPRREAKGKGKAKGVNKDTLVQNARGKGEPAASVMAGLCSIRSQQQQQQQMLMMAAALAGQPAMMGMRGMWVRQ